MFGTVMRARVKPDQRDRFLEWLRTYDARRHPDGFESTELAWEDRDPNRVVMVVHFRDRESYMANAASTEQDQEYRQMRDYLDGDPEWIDVRYERTESP